MTISSVHKREKARVYAEILFEAVKDSNNVFSVTNEVFLILEALRESGELRQTLSDRAVPQKTKEAIIGDIFSGFTAETLETLKVMVEREDLLILSRVYDTFVSLAEEALQAVIIDVTTVVPLDDALRQQIISKYSTQMGTGVLLREHIDPSLIGGIVLSTHGQRIDASVSSQLENARHTLSRTK